MAVATPSLDLDEAVMQQAKRVFAAQTGKQTEDLERIYFSDTLAFAIDRYLTHITDHLKAAGFRRQKPERGRPRRVSRELWDRLGQLASDEYDTSRIALVRAALGLLAADTPLSVAEPSETVPTS